MALKKGIKELIAEAEKKSKGISAEAAQAKLNDPDTVFVDLREKVAKITVGGDEASRLKHVSRGKLLPRERVRTLLDPGSPFLEIGQLAAFGMYGGEVPSASIITGIGRIAGRECVIVANDA